MCVIGKLFCRFCDNLITPKALIQLCDALLLQKVASGEIKPGDQLAGYWAYEENKPSNLAVPEAWDPRQCPFLEPGEVGSYENPCSNPGCKRSPKGREGTGPANPLPFLPRRVTQPDVHGAEYVVNYYNAWRVEANDDKQRFPTIRYPRAGDPRIVAWARVSLPYLTP